MGRPATKRRSRALRRAGELPRPRDAMATLRSRAVTALEWASFWRAQHDADSARACVLLATCARRDADAYRAWKGTGVLP